MIRLFTFTDLNRVLEIERHSFPKSPYSASTFVQLYWFYPKTFWVYTQASSDQGRENLIGYLIVSKDGHLISIAIHPRYRRKGIGKELIQKAMELLSTKRIRAEVRQSNHGAIAFYQRMGFQITGTIPNYYGDEDALIVQWTPSPSQTLKDASTKDKLSGINKPS